MHVVFFLLDTFFFFLVGAALLRAWMNYQRIHMSAQPGRLVIAVTEWLVAPVRRILPRSLLQSRIDWGSLMTALLFALAYGGLWLILVSTFKPVEASSAALLLAIPTLAIKLLLRTLLQGLMMMLLAYAVLSWVQPQSPILGTLDRLCAPVLRPVRKIVPTLGGVDLSVLVMIILLQVGLILLG
ncbi:MAG: YggT family protein [Hydrogenophaga sp.]|uniref:YggT family protein n=1 Tax=Hydrogenophaga sp. TaxID=1904254 RepID=UPI002753D869|nr:YggT family protein [Hydrogenophaga sp.]MDP2416798.1 YggT family protein [Hydrogenophaga sp.]MDZ4187609.1 YggT family protein [Hydrogenophaga sp.]